MVRMSTIVQHTTNLATAPQHRATAAVRGFVSGFWLSWQVETNWADPWLIFVYILARPISGVLILWFMLVAVQGATGSLSREGFAFVFLGNAFFTLVGAVPFGMTWAVISDREHYGMLKYMYLAPICLSSYVLGRGLANALKTLAGLVLLLAGGVWLLSLPLSLVGDRLLLLSAAILLGLIQLLGLGLLLSGAVLNMTRHAYFLSEGVAGALYLLIGALVPLSLLPPVLQPFALAIPMTYTLELIRRCSMQNALAWSGHLAVLSDVDLLLLVAAGAAILWLTCSWVFRVGQTRAWKNGRFEETTGF